MMDHYIVLFGQIGAMERKINEYARDGYTHVHTHIFSGDGLRFVVTMKKVE